jgi:tetratricopeptide (TPR) repeat protein
MSARGNITSVFAALLVAALAAQALLVRKVDALRPQATLEEVLYVPSAEALKRMSLGYTGLLANIYWTRAVQYFGKKHIQRSKRFDLLYPLLDLTTSLDPHLLPAYEFGATFLTQTPPEGSGQADKAVQLLSKGIAANPEEWRLYYNLGFVQYLELHDYQAAAHSFQVAQTKPNAPELRPLAARMAERGGDVSTARALWEFAYKNGADEAIRQNARKHLFALMIDAGIAELEKTVETYRQQTGRLPRSWRELVEAGLLRGEPVDPDGEPLRLLDGKVELANPDKVPFITKGRPEAKQPSIRPDKAVQ